MGGMTTIGKKKWKLLDVSGRIVVDFLCDPQYLWIVGILLLISEIFVNLLIVLKVPYTEIDWIAYVQEVQGFLNGTRDYSQIAGSTGPCVYPAGFLYIYSAFYYLTSEGTNIAAAQYLFVVIYVLHLSLVFRLMAKSKKVPPYVLIIMTFTSHRIHSIFVLRLFNDPVAMLFLYGALNAFADNRWSLGSVLFSLAVSIKMNVLLFAPALFFAYLAILGPLQTFFQLAICGAVQLLLGFPFLRSYPLQYIRGAFDLGRVFNFKWTVNWRFLPQEIFVHPGFHAILLCIHICVLLASFKTWWKMLKSYAVLNASESQKSEILQLLLLPLFMSNYIGVVFARSLHYQFYVWYYHQLHYLCWSTHFSFKFKLLILGLIEMAWNTYPSTNFSSGALHFAHVSLLLGLFHYLRKMNLGTENIKVVHKNN